LMLLSCNEKKGRRIVIKPQAVIKEDEFVNVSNIVPSEKTSLVDSFFTAISDNNDFNGTVLVTDKDKSFTKKLSVMPILKPKKHSQKTQYFN